MASDKMGGNEMGHWIKWLKIKWVAIKWDRGSNGWG